MFFIYCLLSLGKRPTRDFTLQLLFAALLLGDALGLGYLVLGAARRGGGAAIGDQGMAMLVGVKAGDLGPLLEQGG
jgi:hypothetical protein